MLTAEELAVIKARYNAVVFPIPTPDISLLHDMQALLRHTHAQGTVIDEARLLIEELRGFVEAAVEVGDEEAETELALIDAFLGRNKRD